MLINVAMTLRNKQTRGVAHFLFNNNLGIFEVQQV